MGFTQPMVLYLHCRLATKNKSLALMKLGELARYASKVPSIHFYPYHSYDHDLAAGSALLGYSV